MKRLDARTAGTSRAAFSLAVVATVAALAVVIPAARPASAHGLLVTSDPANGASLRSPVDGVSLAFTEKPAPYAFFAVTAPSGARVDDQWTNAEPYRLEKPVIEYQRVDGQWQPRELHAGFPVRVPVTHWPERGPYVIRYHSVASDGDVVMGDVRFTYQGAVTAAPPGWTAPTAGPSAELLAAARTHGSAAPVTAGAAPAAAPGTAEAASATDDRGPWPWLVPVLLVAAVGGAVALALTGPSGHRLRRRRR